MTMAWLLGTLIKATALLVTVALAAAVFRRASASLRHLLWTAGIVGVLALPLLTLTVPWRLPVLPSVMTARLLQPEEGAARQVGAAPEAVPENAAPRVDAARQPTSTAEQVNGGSAQRSATPPASAETTSKALPTWAILAVAWAIIAALLLIRLLLGSAVLAHAVRGATPLTARGWTRPLLEAADRLGLGRLPRLVSSNRLPMPYACGILRPTIVLPAGADAWTDRQRRVVLCHELAHLRRFDLVLNALAQVACALWWFHPLVWIATRNLRTESERACDDLVLGLGTRASEYADHLLTIVSQAARARTPAVALPMAQRHEFEGRMLAILERGARRSPTSRRQSVVVLAAAAAVLLPLVAAAPTTAAPAAPVVPQVPQDTTVRADTASATDRDVATDRSSTNPMAPPATDEASGTDRTATASPPAGTPEAPATRDAQDSNRVVSALTNALVHDSVAAVRKNAAYALGQMEAAAAVPPLSESVMHDPSPAVREMAGWALGQVGSRYATNALSDAASQDASEHVRAIAVWALGQLEDPTSVTSLSSIVANDGSPEVRYRAAWALGSIGAGAAPAALIAALQDTTTKVRLMAAWALGQIGDDSAAPALATALGDQDRGVRLAVLWALGQMDGDLAQAALLKALDDPDPEVRGRAARVLGGGYLEPWPQPWPMPLFGGHLAAGDR